MIIQHFLYSDIEIQYTNVYIATQFNKLVSDDVVFICLCGFDNNNKIMNKQGIKKLIK